VRKLAGTQSLPTSGDYDLVRKGAYPGQEYKVELLQSGGINCEVLGTSVHVIVHGGSGLDNGKWHQIQCVSNSAGVQLLIDGAVAGSSAKVAGSISNTSPVEIGAHPGVTGTRAGSTRSRSPLADSQRLHVEVMH